MGDGREAVLAATATYSHMDVFRGKLILAPMVRCGTLPLRLLALQMGADLMYTEETIDFKILKSRRVDNRLLGTVDYMLADDTVVYRTCAEERGKVVFQLASADPGRAGAAVKKVGADALAVDLNMGCPKEFSCSGGMGAAMMTKPDLATDVLTQMVEANKPRPVTCKLRVFEDEAESLELVEKLASSGVVAVALHGRTKVERPRHPMRESTVKYVAQNLKLPLIANGGSYDFSCHADIVSFQSRCEASSVMVGRAALRNASILRAAGMVTPEEIQRLYIQQCILYDNCVQKSKYTLLYMVPDQETPVGTAIKAAGSLAEIAVALEITPFYRKVLADRECIAHTITANIGLYRANKLSYKRLKTETGETLVINCKYNSRLVARPPKAELHNWLRQRSFPNPKYLSVRREDRCYTCTLHVQDVAISVPFRDQSKQLLEHSCALAALIYLEIWLWKEEYNG